MSVTLRNTLSRSMVELAAPTARPIGLYTCGPTVYGVAHLGNLRTYVFEDVLKRVLRTAGYPVKHVMNVTDVGHLVGDQDEGADKVEEQAKREQRSAIEIARHYESIFFHDLDQLGILPPDVILRATETIADQIALVTQIEANGFTYRTSDGVYFDTSKLPSYGAMSGQDRSAKQAGARVEVNTEKRHPADFALWKLSQPDEHRQMEWPSPWGVGYPGWHLECSAMSIREFPDGLDIHCGGIDHIPVHHENERAQNEAAGRPDFVQIWMHGEFLVLPEKRMGKSEGNAITLADVVARGIHPLAYRYLCLQTHYRSPLTFRWEALEAAHRGLVDLWRRIDALPVTTDGAPREMEQFRRALEDDLNTPRALAVMHHALESLSDPADQVATLEYFDTVLGLELSPNPARSAARSENIPPEVTALMSARDAARTAKDFARADEIRNEIEATGYDVMDGPDGTTVRRRL